VTVANLLVQTNEKHQHLAELIIVKTFENINIIDILLLLCYQILDHTVYSKYNNNCICNNCNLDFPAHPPFWCFNKLTVVRFNNRSGDLSILHVYVISFLTVDVIVVGEEVKTYL
jgi:hypothetical protein